MTARTPEEIVADIRDATAELRRVSVRFEARRTRLDREQGQAENALVVRRAELIEELAAAAAPILMRGDAELRSRETPDGTYGLRLHPRKLVFLRDEAHTTTLLRARGHQHCIRTVEQLDRRAIGQLGPTELRLCGARLDQEQSFYVRLSDGTTLTLSPAPSPGGPDAD